MFLGALEMLSMEMKAAGMYVSRGLSYQETEVWFYVPNSQVFSYFSIFFFLVQSTLDITIQKLGKMQKQSFADVLQRSGS